MGPVSTTKDVAFPVQVVDREESFDLTADGPRYDTKICRPSRGSLRVRRIRRILGPVTTPKVVAILVPVVDREESINQTADGPRYNTKSCRRPRGGCRVRRELLSNV
ncbi:hypothetical protein L484_001614 [Morus notabilis]|uniref:Uncharacterized protein n=1 Tax=Morus notabilis TaxID=981085 RepID=W9RIM3_9ROSA|nr:hypothetical protein L484_001614 [Morus notabilis]